ncbi:glycosyltransferase family 2 protein [Confluentibacter sediminis]|uniref:glycosyltransferase family 2 protein n=1 Tax=Confluentibacter sediminis TaxID=2219045 RepID=UPI000DAC3B4B|nr:glycosyltransferase family 2 protein [Confluentibacter sediminis]
MISVVIPLYNKETTIIKTVSSVLNQTYTDFELIIVDDGSLDKSITLLKNTFNTNECIKIVSQKNQGVSVARNTGVENSKYNLIAFLDGDDLWEPTYLENMHNIYLKFPNAGMYCCAGFIKNADGSIFKRINNKITEKYSKISFFQNPHVFLHTSATMVQKDVFYRAKGFPPGMLRNQDYALFFSIALISDVCYCNIPLSTYVGGVPNQATSSFTMKTLNSVISRHNKVYNNWIQSNKTKNDFLIFTKYELRHQFKVHIIKNEYDFLDSFFRNLDLKLLKEFHFIERFMYKRKKLKFLSKLTINITKVRWRLRGYPIFTSY